MAVLNPQELKETASRRISEASFDPRKLVLIHTGVIVALNLAVSGLNLYLNQQLDSTGGLGGLGLRSMLQTAQTVLSYCSTLFTPFWVAGLLFAMLSVARGQNAGPNSLFRGFRRFGSVLGYALWETTIFMVLSIALCYAVTFLYLMTPLASPILDFMQELMTNPEIFLSNGSIDMSMIPLETLYPMMMPLLVIYGVTAIALVTYLSYHFRMGMFLLIEGVPRGALGAFMVSSRLMKGHKWQMLKLDLSFWWYYLLEALLMAVLYLDVILELAGVALPVSGTVMFFITIVLYGALQLVLHWFVKAHVDVTFATAYEAIYREVVPENPEEPGIRTL